MGPDSCDLFLGDNIEPEFAAGIEQKQINRYPVAESLQDLQINRRKIRDAEDCKAPWKFSRQMFCIGKAFHQIPMQTCTVRCYDLPRQPAP